MGNLREAVAELELGKGDSYELVIILSKASSNNKSWRSDAAEWCANCESDLAVAKAIKAVCVFEPGKASDWLKLVTLPIREKDNCTVNISGGLFVGGALGVLMSALWLDSCDTVQYLKESDFSKELLASILAEIAYFQVDTRSKKSSSAVYSISEEFSRLQSKVVKDYLGGDGWGGWQTRYGRVGEIYKAIISSMKNGPHCPSELDFVPIGSLINDLAYPIFKRMRHYGRLKATCSVLDQDSYYSLFRTLG